MVAASCSLNPKNVSKIKRYRLLIVSLLGLYQVFQSSRSILEAGAIPQLFDSRELSVLPPSDGPFNITKLDNFSDDAREVSESIPSINFTKLDNSSDGTRVVSVSPPSDGAFNITKLDNSSDLSMPPPSHEAFNITKLDSKDYFSACVLVNDDNHYLIEWLAYHYHVMPLRDIIISVVPLSRTSPKQVLDRWRDRINIIEWDDSNIFPPELLPNRNDTALQTHRDRQTRFNANCLRDLHERGREWVLMVDVDEYMVFNPKLQDDPADPLYQPLNQTVPTVAEPGAFLKFIQSIPDPMPSFPLMNSPCIPVPRRQFGVLESTSQEIQDLVPPGYNASQFMTLRWRKYGESDWLRKFTLRKTLIDLSRVNHTDIPEKSDPHRPVETYCPDRTSTEDHGKSFFLAHHYLGTWEQFTYRTDSRLEDKKHKGWRMKEYGKRKSGDKTSHVDARPWLQGFVNAVGEEEAARLLDRVGVLDPIPPATESAK